jgi:hypothetical protein
VHAEYKAGRDVKISKCNFADVTEKRAYDIFEPEWNCEDEIRLGTDVVNIGDGPKFVCGSSVLASTAECIVYSIGSNYDFSFENAVHTLAPHCEIHTFDGTLPLEERSLPEKLEDRNIHFHNWNIIAKCGVAQQRYFRDQSWFDIPVLCVSETLQKLGHGLKTVNWLKVDCEGCEFDVVPKFLESSIEIHQILMEVHGVNATKIAGLFQSLHAADMMIFHKERNQWGCNGYSCVEFSLLSSTYALKVLHEYLS